VDDVIYLNKLELGILDKLYLGLKTNYNNPQTKSFYIEQMDYIH
jgi:hypothetical protein